jgi:WD40 repeat protein
VALLFLPKLTLPMLHHLRARVYPTRFSAHGAEQPQAGLRPGSSGSTSCRDALVVLAAAEPPEVLALLFEPLRQVIITGGSSGTIRVWAHDQLLGQHVGHNGPVMCLCLDACLLFSGSQDASIRMWDACPSSWTTGGTSTQQHSGSTSPGKQHKAVPCSTPFSVLLSHRAPVTGLAVLASTGLLLSCGEDGQLLMWSYWHGTELAKFEVGGQPLTCLSVYQDQATGHARALVGSAAGQLLSFGVSNEQPELPADDTSD